jgi:hypothetical protein
MRRPRTVRHLFGIKDEPHPWSDLHDAVCDARQGYRQTAESRTLTPPPPV